MTMKKIWFRTEHIYAESTDGKILKQSLLWYPRLANASDEQKNAFTIGLDGIHWPDLDTDISFESFLYDDAEPTPLQRFFLTHKELNISEFSKRIGLNATLLRNYINGFKTPSKERETSIMNAIRELGKEYMSLGSIPPCVADEQEVHYSTKHPQ